LVTINTDRINAQFNYEIDTSFTPLRKHKNSRDSVLFFNLCNNAFLIIQAKWVKFEVDYEKLGKNYGLLKTLNRFDIRQAVYRLRALASSCMCVYSKIAFLFLAHE